MTGVDLEASVAPRCRVRGAALVLASAAVALVIRLVVVAPGSSDRTPPEPARAAFAAPSGARWVGAGDVVLAVPTSWADSQYGCEDDPRPAVVYDAGYWTTCQDTAAGRDRRPTALWVLTTRAARSGYGGEAYLRAREELPGLGARRSEPWHEGGDFGRYWFQSLVVPSVHTLFVAQATSRAEVERIVASARRTPPGVAAPPGTPGSDLAAAWALLHGYDVQVHEVGGYYRAGSVIGSDPDFGTPLRRGDTIVLTVSTGLGPEQAMSNDFLARQGVHVEPLGTLSVTEQQQVARSRARIEARLTEHPSPWDTQLVLRRITADDPSRHGVPEIRHRLVWLLLTPRSLVESLGGPCCGPAPRAGLGREISVYDALTAAFLWGASF
jgi:hypothetical protein